MLEVSYKPASPSRRSGASPNVVTMICKNSSKKNQMQCNGTVCSTSSPEGEEHRSQASADVLNTFVDKDETLKAGRTWKQWLKEPGFYKVTFLKPYNKIKLSLFFSHPHLSTWLNLRSSIKLTPIRVELDKNRGSLCS